MEKVKPYTHKVQYYETDKMSIVHHSNYIRFFEEARTYWLDQLGYGFDRMEAEGIVSPVTSVTCNFRHTCGYCDDLQVDIRFDSMTTFKVTFAYKITCKDKIICTGTSTHAFFENEKPVVFAERFKELYERMLEQLKD